jgi:hypothetical protein
LSLVSRIGLIFHTVTPGPTGFFVSLSYVLEDFIKKQLLKVAEFRDYRRSQAPAPSVDRVDWRAW